MDVFVRRGVLAALVLYAALSVLQVFAVGPFQTADEGPHVDYALQVWRGNLPEAGGKIVDTPIEHQKPQIQFVANHPPLYHAIVGSLLRLGVATDHSVGGLFAARLLTASFTLGTIALTAAIALLVGGRHRGQLAVAASALVAVFSPLTFASATVQNDSLSALLVTAMLYVVIRILLTGSTPRLLAWLAACSAGAALTRATSWAMVGIAVVALGVGALLDPGDVRSQQLRVALRRAVLVVGAALAASAWFYLLSVARYGDPLGGSVVYEIASKRRREPSADSILQYLADPGSWGQLWRQAFGGRNSRRAISPTVATNLTWLVVVIVALGAITLAIRTIATRRSPDHASSQLKTLWFSRLVLAVVLLAFVLEISTHVVKLGWPHGRYLAPAVAPYAIGIAAACLALPWRRNGWAWLTVFAAHIAGVVIFELYILRRRAALVGVDPLKVFERSLEINGVPAAALVMWLLIACACGGATMVIVSVWRLRQVSNATDSAWIEPTA